MKKILYLKLPNGIEPFKEWIKELDPRSRIRLLIDRVAAGGSRKNIKSLGDGILK